jgi:NAD(P)-dependent dehydrogenase (short-subunit alcohol dehydrogenase family)
MTERFTGRVAIVTGASGGMGKAIAEAFVAEGAAVLLADLDERGADVASALVDGGGRAMFQRVDVSSADDVAAMVGRAVDEWGRLDCAVNAAAIEGESVPLADVEDDLWDRMLAVNLRSVFLCMKHELRAMLAQERGGAIVNIASTNSFRPQPHQSAYTASKFGVLGLTKAAAIDYARHGVRINAICPGAIDTPMLRNAIARRGRSESDVIDRLTLTGRFGRPDEIAAAALWLCSDESSFTVGHALAVDGGYLSR